MARSLLNRWQAAVRYFLAGLVVAGSARADQVLLSKIMYHPVGDLPEYVEIHNNTANAVDLADWRLKGGIEFRFPSFSAADPMASWMKPFERIVISMADAKTTRDAYKIAPNVRVLGPWIGRLHKQGDRLKLLDKNGLTVSTVKYLDRAPWPAAANGGGHALVVRNPDRRIDDWRNWTVSTKPGGAAGTESGVRGILIYLAIYLVMTAGAFAVVLSMRQGGKMVEGISDLSGLSKTHPAMALAFAIFLFSLAGIPPLAGFFGKLYVFLAAVEAGLYTLAVVGVLASVVGAYYYLRIIKIMYFDEAVEPLYRGIGAGLGFIMAVNALLIVAFTLAPSPLVDFAGAAAAEPHNAGAGGLHNRGRQFQIGRDAARIEGEDGQ